MNTIVYGRGQASCGAVGADQTPGMCDVFSRVQPQNVIVTYEQTGLGFAGRPGGPVPTITVELTGLTFNYVFLGGLFGPITMPPMRTTKPASMCTPRATIRPAYCDHFKKPTPMMFSKPLKITEQRLHVTLAGTDASSCCSAPRALAVRQPLPRREGRGLARRLADTRGAGHHLAAHRRARRRPPRRPPRPRAPAAAPRRRPPSSSSATASPSRPRALLKLQIADWLPKGCSAHELLQACEQALRPPRAPPCSATCTAFIPAIGGAGATTLALSAIGAMCGKGRAQAPACCYVDLNLQAGAAADYLDLAPSLDLGEIAASPQRLDGHLLEVMLTRHRAASRCSPRLPRSCPRWTSIRRSSAGCSTSPPPSSTASSSTCPRSGCRGARPWCEAPIASSSSAT